MAEPTDEAAAAFNAGVQSHIDAKAELGITISWKDGVIQFGNFLKNYADDPEGVDRYFAGLALDPVDVEARVTGLEGTSADHEGRLRALEP